VARVRSLAQAAVVEVPEIAGDRPLPFERARAVENDGRARRDHQVLARDGDRRALDEHLEIALGARPHLARVVAHPQGRAIAARAIVGVNHGPTARALAIAELPEVAQALAVGIGRARGVEVLERAIRLQHLRGRDLELETRVNVGDRVQPVGAQDLRPEVRVTQMLRREVAQRVPFLDADRQDLVGLRKRAKPGQAENAQHR
jgi:hypothetical protein